MNSHEVLLGDLRVGLLERFDDPYDTHRFTPDRQRLAMRARPVATARAPACCIRPISASSAPARPLVAAAIG